MSSAAGLAYHLINAIIPIAIVLVSVLGFTIGRMNTAAHTRLIESLKNVFPAAISSQNFLESAFTAVNKNTGLLTILALLVAIFSGSQLFTSLEGYFDIIYRTDTRKTMAKYIIAVLMLFVFIILIPLMVFASSIPALILWFIEHAAFNNLPGIAQLMRNGIVLSAASILESLIVTWILFEAMYLIVPNQKIRFKQSWKGALVSALLLEIFMVLFPFYITHFMGSYTGVMGFLLISLFFFYYFAVILLVGAEVNAFYATGVHALPDNLANFLHREADDSRSVL